MQPIDARRRDIVLGIAGMLAGCTGGPLGLVGEPGPPVAAPDVRVGDRWVYHCVDGFRVADIWDETQVVTAAGPQGITVRVTCKGPNTDIVRTEEWVAPGLVRVGAVMDIETRRFTTPLQRYRFPLAPGATWSQYVDNYNEFARKAGQFNYYARVGGWKSVTVGAGTFDTIFINVLMRMDDEEFWRWPTECNYALWYAPAVGAMIQESKEAQYTEKSGPDPIAVRTQHSTITLTAYSRVR